MGTVEAGVCGDEDLGSGLLEFCGLDMWYGMKCQG